MATLIQRQGTATSDLQEVEAQYRASRSVSWPLDVGSLGSYALAMISGDISQATWGGPGAIFSFRWTNATNLAVLRSVRMSMGVQGTAMAAGRVRMELYFARSFTVADAGGTGATLTGNNQKKRTSFGTTLVGAIQMATTSVLTPGTRTLDAQPFAQWVGASPTTTNTVIIPAGTVLWTRDSSDEYPGVLAQNEGFVLNAQIGSASGLWVFGIQIEWAEVAAF